jgi:hypothetical protein
MQGVSLYVGDGAAIKHPILRTRGGQLIGHASIEQQLVWCESAHVSRAVFTHCGREWVARFICAPRSCMTV